MTEINQANLFMSDSDSGSDSGSDSEILSSETDVDSAGSLRDFVDGDGSEFLPDSETASVASMRSGRRLQMSDALDFVILELMRLRDLLHEGDAVVTAESGTNT